MIDLKISKKNKAENESSQPIDLAKDVCHSYIQAKIHESAKNENKKKFFTAIADSFSSEEIARKTLSSIPSSYSLEYAQEAYAKYNPGWKVLNLEVEDGSWVCLLEEDPSFRAASFEVEEDGDTYVVKKEIRNGSLTIDDERLKQENPDLYNEVTTPVEIEWLNKLVEDFGLDAEAVADKITTYGFSRQLLPIEVLTTEQIDSLQNYLYESKKVIAITVRKVSK